MALTRRFRKNPRRKQSKVSKYQRKSSTNRRKTFNLFGLFKKIRTRKVRKQKGG